ncbi:hypothetical protein BH11MYX4_BH11MYX4_29430 [soil metagenome]
MAVTAALLLQACTCARPAKETREPPVAQASARLATSTSQPAPAAARGMWVWSTGKRLGDEAALATLLGSCQRAGVDEISLSVDAGVLDDARLPALVAGLRAAHIRVEALMGEAVWYRPEGRAPMLALIDAVAAYDKKHPEAGFAGIHLDVEPHQLPENKGDHGFVPLLAAAVAEASAHAAQRDLTSSVDLPRFALEEHGPAFARAADRVFVMLYELRGKSAQSLTKSSGNVVDRTYAGAGAEVTSRIVIGLSVDDYPADLEAMLAALERSHGGSSAARYGGWAIHDEAKYRARQHP